MEAEFSKNLEFKIFKEGKNTMLECGGKKVALPPTGSKDWKTEIFKEPKSGIPFVSNGKNSKRCIEFFQEKEDDDADTSTEEKEQKGKGKGSDEKKPKVAEAGEAKKLAAMKVPLPGANSVSNILYLFIFITDIYLEKYIPN